MSLEQAKEFYQRIGTDPALQEKLQGFNAESDWDAVRQVASDAGYTFSKEEGEEAFRSLYGVLPAGQQLSDEDLADVAGGKGGGGGGQAPTQAVGCGPGPSTAQPGWSLSRKCGGAHPCSDCDY